MVKTSGCILTVGLLLCAAAKAGAQTGFGGGPMPDGPMGRLPPEMAELQREQERIVKEADPELAAYQEKIQGVESEIGTVVKRFADKKIDKDRARAELLPLMKEEQELRDDPNFQVEQRLSQAALSSPEFRKKMAKIQEKMNRAMQKLMAERMRKARGGRPVVHARSAPNAQPPLNGQAR
ncbi:MAG: hypothetical protein HKL90_10340 [Elusimicrobia bacterium]|nr:hypothetical protein [Elusimicrobiota bacterium]